MALRIRIIFGVFTAFILLVDVISFLGLATDFAFMREWPFILIFCIVPVLIIVRLGIYGKQFVSINPGGFPAGFFTFTGIFLAFYIPKFLYIAILLVENIIIALAYIILKAFADPAVFGEYYGMTFLNKISLMILPISGFAFLAIISGMVFGKFNFKLRELETSFPDLPAAFEGFRIVHISDLHLGSLAGHQDKIRKAVELMNSTDPDLVLFSGDLVNNLAEEAENWTEILAGIRSRHGKFAITGNHDYGEFMDWPDEASRHANMDRLVKAHEKSGFKILMNDSYKVRLGKEEIHILGVENWGLPPFQQYGDLKKAMQNTGDHNFRILMSHDPSHWDEEVVEKTNIQLTLSGHTHGFQFGIRTRRFNWSPVQMKYPRWIGMYQQGHQKLHVSPGLGYIGYAGRIGIPPEITLITLRKSIS